MQLNNSIDTAQQDQQHSSEHERQKTDEWLDLVSSRGPPGEVDIVHEQDTEDCQGDDLEDQTDKRDIYPDLYIVLGAPHAWNAASSGLQE